jgi:putative membrane protein
MPLIAIILAVMIALLHVSILVMEMLLWETARVRRVFGTTADFAASTKSMAANQGLYNGFLAAGLFWGLWQKEAGYDVVAFFLICVVVAGVYGGITVSRRIFVVQALPAILALTAMAFD